MYISSISIITLFLLASFLQVSHAKDCRQANILNLHRAYSNKKIPPSAQPIKLEKAKDESREKLEKLNYHSVKLNKSLSLNDYVESNCVNALVVVKNGEIVYEKYSQRADASDKLYSASMAKTLTSIMIGILIDEKKLELSTKVVEIYPELSQSAFASDTVEDLLRMNSSAKLKDCSENCSDGDNQKLHPQLSPRTNTLEYLSQKVDKGDKPFFYSAANTAVLGLIIKRVSSKDPADFWAEKVWFVVGAESDGYWIVNNQKELGFQCCYTATARDWLKVGAMLANYGEINQRQVLSKSYVEAMMSDNIKNPQPQRRYGYGLHIWKPRKTPRNDMKTIVMVGSFGQYLAVDPVSKVVIFHSGNGRGETALLDEWDELMFAIQNSLN